MKFESILEFSTRFNVKKMCEVLGVNRSSYYRWLKAKKNREEKNLKERRDIELVEKAFVGSGRISGYRNITKNMKAQGEESMMAEDNGEPTLSNMIEIVKYIFAVKQQEANARKQAAENAEKRRRILEVLAQKQDEALHDLSEADLQKMLEELK